jgi:pimeloyl-ACP methyl ester carboxylesterase
MRAARFSSALRGIDLEALQQRAVRGLDHLLGANSVPLSHAIDAERHEIATADAGTISYYADTRAEGRPLVLLHGIHAAASSYDMRPLFEAFRGQRPVYALDLPGFGYAERSARPYRPETYVHAIEHLLRHLTTSDGVDVIALSLTSEYVAKVALEMPELVRSLALISPTGFSSPQEVKRLQRLARRGDNTRAEWISGSPAGRLLFEALASKPSIRYFLRRSFEGRLDEGMLSYAHTTSHQPGAYRAPMAFVAGALFPAGNPLNTYARVRVPVLVLYDQDPHTGFGELSSFAAEHTNYKPVRVPHTRGLPHFDAPEQTNEALRTFFARDADKSEARADGRMPPSRFVGSA